MKSFNCQVCGQLIFFENAQCLRCLNTLGYVPDQFSLCVLEAAGDNVWRVPNGNLYRQCRNTIDWQMCNWMVPITSDTDYCLSCDLNETIPDLSIPANRHYWRKLEEGKRRLVYSLTRLGLPVVSKRLNESNGLSFEFLREPEAPEFEDDRVFTGHHNGRITVNVVEADDAERERIRQNLDEVYRSILGHFRHESGHYYWWQLVQESDWLPKFRNLFGDETSDYDQAVGHYYKNGPAQGWQNTFISAYASSHPWEDWAESWAHYLTIVDALETAREFGVVVSRDGSRHLFAAPDSYRATTFDEMLDEWLPLTYAVNSINRSGGLNDLYPFVLPGPAIEKLRFVHNLIKQRNAA